MNTVSLVNSFRTMKVLSPIQTAFRTLLVAALLLGVSPASAQQQFQGVCSRVRMVIAQELTLERIGFEATLEVTNNDGEDPLTDFSAALTFQTTGTNVQDASSLFFVRAPTFENINAIDGSGVVGPTEKAVVRWFIIPKIAAGGTNALGLQYRIGCNLAAKIRGAELPKDILFAIPDVITVRPDPQLDITYFQPRDVQGDDPFTPDVESPIPFTLGVLVKNSGYGTARKLKIDSQQPKIVENENGLLLVARLLGARVMDSPLRSASLLVDLGDIFPAQTKKGAWDMITSLSGEFVEFKASYKHASELGGEETSVIKSLEAHFIAKEVLNDEPGRDAIKDFLADVDRDENILPETLYESDGAVTPVYYGTNASVISGAGSIGNFQVELDSDVDGWNYIRVSDPGQARLKTTRVLRNDGKELNTNNFWTNVRYTREGNVRQAFLNIFDRTRTGTYQYAVVQEAVGTGDTNPPVTTIHFAGPVTEAGGKHYITPDTQIFFLSEDALPVSIVYSLTNSPFFPALPFNLTAPGEYQIVYYATDSLNNREANRTNILVVSGESTLDLANINAPAQPIFVTGDALSIRPSLAPISFQAAPNPTPVSASLDIFQGVLGFATVSGVPSSPTRSTSATLAVGGENVDFYKYRLNGGAWSADRALGTPISLSGLSVGQNTVAVLGRSGHGTYLPESNAVSVSWFVNPLAPVTAVAGTPATPSRTRNATLVVSGGPTDYRWTINHGFYRAETPVANPIIITNLSPGLQTIAVNAKTSGVFQGTNNATTVQWNFDPFYGFTLPALAKVHTVQYSNIGTATQTFTWDGRGSNGTLLPPGWYTVRVTLADTLGRTNFGTRLVQIEDLSGAASALADVVRGPKNPYARRNVAVWQDQSDGTWQIYAQDISSNGAPIVKLTSGVLARENARTDGRWVAWQGRQTNGNWDVFVKDLNSTNPPQAVTTTSIQDEVNPSVEWPWIVFQTKNNRDASAPWLVRAVNLLTGFSELVSVSTQDQLNPDVQAGRVVWQDWRDVGPGEVYFKNLETGDLRRITTNSFGQYHPAIQDHWIVWQDNRNGQDDLYGFDFLRNREVRLTATAENETRVHLDGPWAVAEDDSLGALTANVKLIHLPSLRSLPLTRTATAKARPALAGSRLVWQDTQNNLASILNASVPSLQAVFENQNAVAITESMAAYQQNAFNLLTLWRNQAGVEEITRYSSLVPNVVSQTARWTNGAPAGDNFNLVAGDFLWIRFNGRRVLDLGENNIAALNLTSGVNVFSHVGFPSQYSAYQLMRQLGLGNVRGVRMLDSESGNWKVALVNNGHPAGPDFTIPKVAVLMIDLANPVNNFKPQ